MSKQLEKRDLYQEITDAVVLAIESGGVNGWSKLWTAIGTGEPTNYASKRAYRGINSLVLWVTQLNAGYSYPLWLTFKQVKERGGHVKKGEKSTPVVFWKTIDREVKSDDGETEVEKIPFLRYYSVFNIEQCEGIEPPDAKLPPQTWNNLKHIETACAALKATLAHGGDLAYYVPARHHVQMPEKKHFPDAGAYYSVFLHEHVHATGHTSLTGRLEEAYKDRTVDRKETYAFEELVAELGSAFLCAHYGVRGTMRHTEYLALWLQRLRNDSKAIFKAARLAQEAADMISGTKYEEIKEAA